MKTCIVVPCFNEANRLRQDSIVDFSGRHPEVDLLFVDDGSRDRTRALLEELVADAPSLSLVVQSSNRGKAEAVRRGMNAAFERGAAYAGYWDADLATPLDELPRFVAELEREPRLEAVFGSRVRMLGRAIRRSGLRHALGRVFATAVARLLDLPVYDTQCGAKLFRVTPILPELFAEPFVAGWCFDVELIARWLAARRGPGLAPLEQVIRELPLERWTDVPGSKVHPLDFFRAWAELWRIRRHYLRPR